jgi:putative thioredoxin
MDTPTHVFDASLPSFEQDVILKSKEVPVLVDFWATWCGPCKTLGPILEKLAADYAGGFLLAKVDVDKEQQLAGYFQIKSIPTVMLVKDGQIVDGFPGALPEGQVREFLKHHGVEPRVEPEAPVAAQPIALDPHEEVIRLRAAVHAEPDKDELKLDLALALINTGAAAEAEKLLDALPANLSTDERAIKAHARLGFAALLQDAPPRQPLEAAIAADPNDLRARHLLGVRLLVEGETEAALQQFIEMLRRDRGYQDQLARRTLIDAFRVIDEPDLVGTYRRKMASLLF